MHGCGTLLWDNCPEDNHDRTCQFVPLVPGGNTGGVEPTLPRVQGWWLGHISVFRPCSNSKNGQIGPWVAVTPGFTVSDRSFQSHMTPRWDCITGGTHDWVLVPYRVMNHFFRGPAPGKMVEIGPGLARTLYPVVSGWSS